MSLLTLETKPGMEGNTPSAHCDKVSKYLRGVREDKAFWFPANACTYRQRSPPINSVAEPVDTRLVSPEEIIHVDLLAIRNIVGRDHESDHGSKEDLRIAVSLYL